MGHPKLDVFRGGLRTSPAKNGGNHFANHGDLTRKNSKNCVVFFRFRQQFGWKSDGNPWDFSIKNRSSRWGFRTIVLRNKWSQPAMAGKKGLSTKYIGRQDGYVT